MRTGQADLPLHGGRCPPWLFEKMRRLGSAIVEAMLVEYPRKTVLERLSDPGWFQAFGCTLGFDWHSSGLTTVVCGALKEGLNPRSHELGLYFAGGKGAQSRQTPRELAEFADDVAPSLPVRRLQRNSRVAAQVDSSAVQDGYQIYHHTFVVTTKGDWAVIQQGLKEEEGWARRYHWLGDDVSDFVEEPHAAVCATDRVSPLNLVARESRKNRRVSNEIAVEDPVNTLREYQRLLDCWESSRDKLNLPSRHDLPGRDSLERALGRIYERPPETFEQLIDLDGIGPKTVRALSMVAEVVWGTTPSYEDPARYAFAHGGKDGHPYPVDRDRYEQSIRVLRTAVQKAKIGRSERMKSLERLSRRREELTRGEPGGGVDPSPKTGPGPAASDSSSPDPAPDSGPQLHLDL